MSLLFEYGEWKKTTNEDDLKSFLRTIWNQRITEQEETESVEGMDNHYQPFLQFDDDMIRANNYVGFIQNGNELIEIYPKVFRSLPSVDKVLMLRHILYWFTYCRKWKFPFTQSSLEPNEIDKFPELIIHLIATQFLETVSEQPLMQYQMQEESLETPRGSINFTRYVNQGLSKGNFHKLECDYEPFLFDNKVNRIIKYCTRLLLPQTRLSENQRLLQETLFILDEVEDVACTLNEINSISLNSFYDNYNLVISVCKTIVEQQIYSNNTYDLSQWCLLFRMEYIFEDFLAGFLQMHFSTKWRVEYQKSNAYLTTKPEAFQMQHDIFLTSKDGLERKIIIDTKYKVRSYSGNDKKKGVSQSDLYQVVSYAYRRGCKDVVLIYPNASQGIRSVSTFEIASGLDSNQIVRVKVAEIPFWSIGNFGNIEASLKASLTEILI
jgi:5-methylcytosine-specific restriction enzyme subunit McrC